MQKYIPFKLRRTKLVLHPLQIYSEVLKLRRLNKNCTRIQNVLLKSFTYGTLLLLVLLPYINVPKYFMLTEYCSVKTLYNSWDSEKKMSTTLLKDYVSSFILIS
jgi:hypothetical protein